MHLAFVRNVQRRQGESRLMVGGGWCSAFAQVTANMYGASFWGGENLLNLCCMCL